VQEWRYDPTTGQWQQVTPSAQNKRRR